MKKSGKGRDAIYWRRRRTRRIGRIWSYVEIIPCGKEGVWVDNDVQYSKVKSLRVEQSGTEQSSGMAILGNIILFKPAHVRALSLRSNQNRCDEYRDMH